MLDQQQAHTRHKTTQATTELHLFTKHTAWNCRPPPDKTVAQKALHLDNPTVASFIHAVVVQSNTEYVADTSKVLYASSH